MFDRTKYLISRIKYLHRIIVFRSVFLNVWKKKIGSKSNLLVGRLVGALYSTNTRRLSGNGEVYDDTRDDVTDASRYTASQRWQCSNYRLFLGANRETSCPVNTCHHRCFSVGGHAEGGRDIRATTPVQGSRGTRHACILFGVYVFLDTPPDEGKSSSPWFLTGALTL